MIGRGLVLLASLGAACVPASDTADEPLGAAGARFAPTATAQGTPFTTSDGWTVTIEHLVLVARVSAQCSAGGGTGYVAWNARDETERWAGALPAAPCVVYAQLEGVFTGSGNSLFGRDRPFVEAELPSSLVGDVFATPDNEDTIIASTSGVNFVQGPAIAFRVRATRAGETKVLALRLASSFLSSPEVTRVKQVYVQRDDVVFARYLVRPERMFAGLEDEQLRFDPLAEADRRGNGDGDIRADELRRLSANEGEGSLCRDTVDYLTGRCATLLDVLARNAQRILVLDE